MSGHKEDDALPQRKLPCAARESAMEADALHLMGNKCSRCLSLPMRLLCTNISVLAHNIFVCVDTEKRVLRASVLCRDHAGDSVVGRFYVTENNSRTCISNKTFNTLLYLVISFMPKSILKPEKGTL